MKELAVTVVGGNRGDGAKGPAMVSTDDSKNLLSDLFLLTLHNSITKTEAWSSGCSKLLANVIC